MINFDFNFADFESAFDSSSSVSVQAPTKMSESDFLPEAPREGCEHLPSVVETKEASSKQEAPAAKPLEERIYSLPPLFSQYPKQSLCDRITTLVTDTFQFIRKLCGKKPKKSSDCFSEIPKDWLKETISFLPPKDFEEALVASASLREKIFSEPEKEDAIDQNAISDPAYQKKLIEQLRLQQGNLETLSQNAQRQIKKLAPRIFALNVQDYNCDPFEKISFADKTIEKIMRLFFNVIDLNITGNWNITPGGLQAILKNPLIALNISENPKLNTLNLFQAIASQCFNLSSLNISRISSAALSVDALFTEIGKLPRLQALNCSYNCFRDPQVALDLVQQYSLQELDISGIEAFSPRIAQVRRDAGLPVFSNDDANTWIAHLPSYHPNLHTLKTTAHVNAESLQDLKNLKTLKCRSIISQKEVRLPSVTDLDISFDRQTDYPIEQPQDALETIATCFPHLETLDLSECWLKRDYKSTFKPLQQLKKLKEIKFKQLGISPAELSSLAPLPSLRKINLVVYNVQQDEYYPPLFDQISIKNFPNLETVIIPYFCKDMKNALATFMKDNPHLKVITEWGEIPVVV